MSNEITSNDNKCCICLDEMLDSDVSKTRCYHTFHTSCLLKYKKCKCPICRQLLYDEDIIDIQLDMVEQEIVVEQLRNVIQDVVQNSMNYRTRRITLLETYMIKIRKIKTQIKNTFNIIIRCLSKIYVAFFLIFCLKILTEILWIGIYESHKFILQN